MAEAREIYDNLEEITLGYLDMLRGRATIVEMDKRIIKCERSWAIIAFYTIREERGKNNPKVSLRRYRKIGGGWRLHTEINMSLKDFNAIRSLSDFATLGT